MIRRLRRALSITGVIIGMLVAGGCSEPPTDQPAGVRRPNVLFIAVDDLNDWIGPLGGHPQALTPALDRLASRAVVFERNYCASPSCNPSRTALLTGLNTTTSGVYSNYQYWRQALPDAVTLPRYFRDHGYWVGGAGKIFHNDQPDPESWDEYFPSKNKHMPDYFYPNPGGTVNMPPFESMYGDFDWSPIDLADSETGDYSSVSWVVEQLEQDRDRPFFLACGIYRPHLPWYVPKKYFDLFPLETVQLPKVLEGDLDDLGDRAREIAARGGDYHRHVVEAGQWRAAVQGYLASIAYADAMVDRLLRALDSSPHAENTIVVLWSDHGWQLGEKEHWRKFALWDNVARTVLIIRAPRGLPGLAGGAEEGGRCRRVTSLVDLYPTLIELTGLPEKTGLDGHSLVPLLADPRTEWEFPAITTYDRFEYSIRNERWRYIRYIDDTEELYDHSNDPEEWTNLAGDPNLAAVKAELATYIPSNPAPLAETSYPLAPHHISPWKSKEDYRRSKEAETGGRR
jgi:arylsulfatase A-like enzyme